MKARTQNSLARSHNEARPAATGFMGNQPTPIFQGDALGGGTAWGFQANGQFVDSPGSNVSLAGDIIGFGPSLVRPNAP